MMLSIYLWASLYVLKAEGISQKIEYSERVSFSWTGMEAVLMINWVSWRPR